MYHTNVLRSDCIMNYNSPLAEPSISRCHNLKQLIPSRNNFKYANTITPIKNIGYYSHTEYR